MSQADKRVPRWAGKLNRNRRANQPAERPTPKATYPATQSVAAPTKAHADDLTSQRISDGIMVAMAAALVVGNLLWFLTRSQSNEVDLQRCDAVAQMLAEVAQKREEKLTDAQWQQFADKLTAQAEAILQEINSEKSAPAKQCLQWALQYRIPRVLKYGRYRATHQEMATRHLLEEARYHLRAGE